MKKSFDMCGSIILHNEMFFIKSEVAHIEPIIVFEVSIAFTTHSMKYDELSRTDLYLMPLGNLRMESGSASSPLSSLIFS